MGEKANEDIDSEKYKENFKLKNKSKCSSLEEVRITMEKIQSK